MSIELISGFLGRIEQNGIKAERAGTGFRRVMEDLAKPTTEAKATLASMGVQIAKTAEGNVDAVATFEALAKANMNFAQAAAIFGTQGSTVALAIAKDIEEVKKLAHENENAGGSLQKMVDIMNSGLTPSLTRLGNAISDAAIQLMNAFLPAIKGVVDWLTSLVRAITEFSKAHPILAGFAVGITALFGGIITVAGVLSLVFAGALFAVRNLVAGKEALIKLGGRLATFFGQNTAGLAKETAALNENTAAQARNAQARQSGAAKAGGAVGSTVPGNLGSGPIPVGLKGAAAIGAVSGLTQTAIDLAPTENAVSKVGELATMIAGFGPVAGTIIAGISSWVKVLTKDVWDLIDVWGIWSSSGRKAPNAAETTKQTEKQMKDTVSSIIQDGMLTGQRYEDMLANLSKVFYMATGKIKLPDELREAFNRAYNQIVGKTKDATAQVGQEWKKIQFGSFSSVFSQAADAFNTIEGKLDAMKNVLEVMDKATSTFYATLNQVNDIKLGGLINEITAATASEKLAATQIAEVQAASAARNILNAQREHDERKALRDQMLAEAQAAIEKELAAENNAQKREAILKQKADIEKDYRAKSLEAEKNLQDAIASEIKKQSDAVKSALEQRRTLEQDIKNEQRDAQRIQSDLAQKSMTEMGRLRDNYGQAVANLNAANALLPTMPEKAMELAKKARDEFRGLATDINALRKDLDSTFKENQEMLRDLGKKGMTPAAAWVSDLDHVKAMIAEAEALMKRGEFEKAAEMAGKARQPAMGLAKAPEGGGFTDAQTAGVARTYLTAAIELQEAAKKGGIAYAQEVNKGVGEGIGKAGIVVKTAQEALLDENTKQLRAHGELLQALTTQYNTIIAQNNKLIEAQGGKGVEAPKTSELMNAAKEGAATGATGALATQMNKAQAAGTIQATGAPSGAISGALPSDLSPGVELHPDVRRAREEAEKRVKLERGQKLNSALEQFPELAGIVSFEDFQNARDARAGEESQRQSRMDTLKALEARAAQLDTSERRGYGVSPQAASRWQSDLDAVVGQPVTGGLVDAMQSRIDQLFEGAANRMGTIVESAKNASYRGDTTPNVTEARSLESAEKIGTHVNAFGEFVGALKEAFKDMSKEVNVRVSLENGEATISRY